MRIPHRVVQIIVTVVVLLQSAATLAERRYALVIGNSNYLLGALENPQNDARDVSRKLKALDFRVTNLRDADFASMRSGVDSFYQKLPHTNAVAVVYYAGHAVQLDNRNFLLPVGERIQSRKDLLTRGYDINHLFKAMAERADLQNVVILDACRNNPFKHARADHNSRGLKTKPSEELGRLNEGLAPVEAPPGTLVAYATEPGNVAADGTGRNGTYTKHLLRYMDEQLDIEVIFKRVRNGVMRETRGRQIPWEHSSLYEAFYINPPKNRDMPSVIPF